MYGYIYKTTNLKNNKIYIGQHISSNFDDSYKGSGTMLRKALNKYGESNFKVELLEKCYSQKQLDELEIKYISLYGSLNTSIGYNIAKGGRGGSHPAWNKGLTKEDERVARYTNTRKLSYKGNIGDRNGNRIKMNNHLNEILPDFEDYWKTHFKKEIYEHFNIGPIAYKKCINILNLDEKNIDRIDFLNKRHVDNWRNSNTFSNKVRIKCIETGEEFDSVQEARIYLGLNSCSSLHNALNNPNKTCRRFHWIRL